MNVIPQAILIKRALNQKKPDLVGFFGSKTMLSECFLFAVLGSAKGVGSNRVFLIKSND